MSIRLLHTADWHVGRTLRGRSRAEEHEATLDALVALAEDGGAQLVVVAGDLFDTAAPTPDAEKLVYRTLLRLADRGRRHVVVIAGNHDHPRRLGAVEPLLGLGNVTVQPFVVAPARGGVLDLHVGGTPTRVALLPWLSHRHAVTAAQLMTGNAAQHNQTFLDRMRDIARALTATFDGDHVNLVAGHLTAVGGAVGGGERAAHTIFAYAVPATIFPPTTTYAALGHLHRHQRIDGPAPTYYAGSPLQLDFGEGENTPGAVLVELAPGRPARVEAVELTAARRLRTLTGTVAELEAQAATTGTAHLRLFVREKNRAGLVDDLRARIPNAVDIRVELASPPSGAAATTAPTRHGRTPGELFGEYLASASIEDARLTTLFDRLVEEDATELDGDDPAGPGRPDAPGDGDGDGGDDAT